MSKKYESTCLLAMMVLLPGWGAAQTANVNDSGKKGQLMVNGVNSKSIVLNLYKDCLNTHRFDLLDAFIAPDYTAVNGVRGAVGFQSTIDAILAAFPDAQWHIEEAIAEREKVYIRWNFQGTHTGTFQQIAATGKKVSNTGMTVYTLKNGKVTATLVFTDRLSFLQQLGVLPADLSALQGKRQ